MKKNGDTFELSATDLVGHLNCLHLTNLDRTVAEGLLGKPKLWDPVISPALLEMRWVVVAATVCVEFVSANCVQS